MCGAGQGQTDEKNRSTGAGGKSGQLVSSSKREEHTAGVERTEGGSFLIKLPCLGAYCKMVWSEQLCVDYWGRKVKGGFQLKGQGQF